MALEPDPAKVIGFPLRLTIQVHEGSEVTRGTKYVIRTDVLFREPPPHAAPASSGGDE